MHGKTTPAETAALKTVILTYPGYLDSMIGLEQEVNVLLRLALPLQDNPIINLGFGYDAQARYFYTNQNSLQSHFGFMDAYDFAGQYLGMDLDTTYVQFEFEGKEYRFQVWKGTYGAGAYTGGEQGWYVKDPQRDYPELEDHVEEITDELGLDDFVPVAAPEDRIRMENSIYNETTGKPIIKQADTKKHDPKGAYWNLATSAYHAGYTKSNLYCEGKLYIEDEGLRQELFNQLSANDDFSEVCLTQEGITYTWHD